MACFANAADHHEPGVCFVVEVGVPHLRRLPPGDKARVFTISPEHLGVGEYTDLPARSSTPTTTSRTAAGSRGPPLPFATSGRRSST